ncbi:MBL fold metallo-hydrolase [Desulfatitalea alkaliphila]|uniref:MBL fold metallo-hydrolase n=1 Tax=Desulfatitalea alkaliphila TaxID=2929485 RepID=A0AA41UHP6_9BACT|nr:MBL fold metallo-hydrolase [Desulfatitalea alkaliphila]MCJ8499244.1 MBL fold metallo-hydrolase [Desulfatitalea alkaliphila]
MIIRAMQVGPLQANCYIVGCEETRHAAVIDPGGDADKILLALANDRLTLKAIINTHGHFDHVSANKALKEASGAELMIHPDDAAMLPHLSQGAAQWGLRSEDSPAPDRLLADGDTVTVGRITFKVLHTPGHTPGGISLATDKVVFVGDTLFSGSIGRTDFPGGDFDTLIRGIHAKLFTLPDDTTVYTGHMEPTTIGKEKRTNPFCALR